MAEFLAVALMVAEVAVALAQSVKTHLLMVVMAVLVQRHLFQVHL
jgi:hypothetical protein